MSDKPRNSVVTCTSTPMLSTLEPPTPAVSNAAAAAMRAAHTCTPPPLSNIGSSSALSLTPRARAALALVPAPSVRKIRAQQTPNVGCTTSVPCGGGRGSARISARSAPPIVTIELPPTRQVHMTAASAHTSSSCAASSGTGARPQQPHMSQPQHITTAAPSTYPAAAFSAYFPANTVPPTPVVWQQGSFNAADYVPEPPVTPMPLTPGPIYDPTGMPSNVSANPATTTTMAAGISQALLSPSLGSVTPHTLPYGNPNAVMAPVATRPPPPEGASLFVPRSPVLLGGGGGGMAPPNININTAGLATQAAVPLPLQCPTPFGLDGGIAVPPPPQTPTPVPVPCSSQSAPMYAMPMMTPGFGPTTLSGNPYPYAYTPTPAVESLDVAFDKLSMTGGTPMSAVPAGGMYMSAMPMQTQGVNPYGHTSANGAATSIDISFANQGQQMNANLFPGGHVGAPNPYAGHWYDTAALAAAATAPQQQYACGGVHTSPPNSMPAVLATTPTAAATTAAVAATPGACLGGVGGGTPVGAVNHANTYPGPSGTHAPAAREDERKTAPTRQAGQKKRFARLPPPPSSRFFQQRRGANYRAQRQQRKMQQQQQHQERGGGRGNGNAIGGKSGTDAGGTQNRGSAIARFASQTLPPSFGTAQPNLGVGVGAASVAFNNPHYKTRLCNNFLNSRPCPYAAKCRFAHGEKELRRLRTFKIDTCRNDLNGYCRYGQSCRYIHTNSPDITRRSPSPAAALAAAASRRQRATPDSDVVETEQSRSREAATTPSSTVENEHATAREPAKATVETVSRPVQRGPPQVAKLSKDERESTKSRKGEPAQSQEVELEADQEQESAVQSVKTATKKRDNIHVAPPSAPLAPSNARLARAKVRKKAKSGTGSDPVSDKLGSGDVDAPCE